MQCESISTTRVNGFSRRSGPACLLVFHLVIGGGSGPRRLECGNDAGRPCGNVYCESDEQREGVKEIEEALVRCKCALGSFREFDHTVDGTQLRQLLDGHSRTGIC